jgi:hypothetical protein
MGKTLTDEEGNSLQCNAEYGGDDQRAQQLVPTDKLNIDQRLLQEYKESISTFSMRENNCLKRVTQAHPAKIYIPTAAAHHNLYLIKGLSPATTWKMHQHQSGNLHKGNLIQSINPQTQISTTNKNQQQQSKTFKISQQDYITKVTIQIDQTIHNNP